MPVISGGIQVDRIFASHQTECRKQAIKTKDMISMKMADKNVIDPAKFYFAPPHLHLCPFPAVDQKQTLMSVEHMSGRVPF